MFLRKVPVVLAIISIIISSAQGYEQRRRRRYNCENEIAKALEKYDRGRYNDTKSILDEVRYQCSGHSAMDTVLYYLAMSYVKTKDPVEAKVEFERLSRDFRNSSFAREAAFRVGYCSYLQTDEPQRDQSFTYDAIRELTEFADRYPESPFADSALVYIEKCRNILAEKEFLNARFYERIDKYEAAIVYYRGLIERFPQSPFVNESRLGMASSLAKVSQPTEARAVLDELLAQDPSPEIERRARSLYGRIQELAQEKKKSPFRRFLEGERESQSSDLSQDTTTDPSSEATVGPAPEPVSEATVEPAPESASEVTVEQAPESASEPVEESTKQAESELPGDGDSHGETNAQNSDTDSLSTQE